MNTIQITLLPNGVNLPLPAYATDHAAGMDLYAAEIHTLESGKYALVPCGFCMALPVGYEAQIRPRSGLAFKHGITVLNAPGTIDADYRGEIKVLLINHGSTAFVIERGMRVAQMVIACHVRINWSEVKSLDQTLRGESGFGSTGDKI